MRFSGIIAASAALLALSSCSGGPTPLERARAIEEDFKSAAGMAFTLDMTADYGERVYDYSLRYEGDAQSGVMTVDSPDSISGVRIMLRDGAASLEYDGVEVFTGEILPEGLSPVDALPVLLGAWSDGSITEAVRESFDGEECVAARFRVSDEVDLRTWFSEKSALPLRAEIYFDGAAVIMCDFYDFKID